MVKPSINRRTAAAAIALAAVAVLGGSAYAAQRPAHASAAKPKSITAAQVKRLVRTYVKNHSTPPSVQFAASYRSDSTHVIKKVGPWTLTVSCLSSGVGLTATGPGVVFGTNSFGTINGGDGPTFQTSHEPKPGTGFGVASTVQGSQTLILRSTGAAYTVTYMMNADQSTPVNCAVLGYAIPLAK